MTAIELQEQKDETQGDLREQIHGVRLEVEKVRTEMVSQVGGLEMRPRRLDRFDGHAGLRRHRRIIGRQVQKLPAFPAWGRVFSSTVNKKMAAGKSALLVYRDSGENNNDWH